MVCHKREEKIAAKKHNKHDRRKKEMGILITLIIIAILWNVFKDSALLKVALFLGIVAILAWIGSYILSFLIYISYGAILLMLLITGIAIFNKLFN